MKLVCSISLSLVFLFQSMGAGMDWCCELPKLDNLVDHYQELHYEDQVSFTDFITNHYGKEKADHNDKHDGELPFQGNHSCCHVHVVTDNIPLISYQLMYFEMESNSSPDFYRLNNVSGISNSIFQPPKFS